MTSPFVLPSHHARDVNVRAELATADLCFPTVQTRELKRAPPCELYKCSQGLDTVSPDSAAQITLQRTCPGSSLLTFHCVESRCWVTASIVRPFMNSTFCL